MGVLSQLRCRRLSLSGYQVPNSLPIPLLGEYLKLVCVGKVLLYPCFSNCFSAYRTFGNAEEFPKVDQGHLHRVHHSTSHFPNSCYYWILISEYETQWLLSGTYSHLAEVTATSEQLRDAYPLINVGVLPLLRLR